MSDFLRRQRGTAIGNLNGNLLHGKIHADLNGLVIRIMAGIFDKVSKRRLQEHLLTVDLQGFFVVRNSHKIESNAISGIQGLHHVNTFVNHFVQANHRPLFIKLYLFVPRQQ